MAEILHALV